MVSSSPQIASHRLHTPSFVRLPVVDVATSASCHFHCHGGQGRGLRKPCRVSLWPLVRIARYCPMRGWNPAAQGSARPGGARRVSREEDGYGYDVVRRLRAAGCGGRRRRLGLWHPPYGCTPPAHSCRYVVPSRCPGPHRKYYGITAPGPGRAHEAARRLVRSSPGPSTASSTALSSTRGSTMNAIHGHPEVTTFVDTGPPLPEQTYDRRGPRRAGRRAGGGHGRPTSTIAGWTRSTDPELYAEELRSAAGLTAVARSRHRMTRLPRHIGPRVHTFISTRSATRWLTSVGVRRPAADLGVRGRASTGMVAAARLDRLDGCPGHDVTEASTTATRSSSAAAAGLAVVGSVQLGRRPLGDRGRLVGRADPRLLLVALNVFAVDDAAQRPSTARRRGGGRESGGALLLPTTSDATTPQQTENRPASRLTAGAQGGVADRRCGL